MAAMLIPAGLTDFFERPWNHSCALCRVWFCDIRSNRKFCSHHRAHGARALRRQSNKPQVDASPEPYFLAFEYELCSEGNEDPWHYKGDKHRNGARTKERDAHDIPFVGIDGEGVSIKNDKGEVTGHDYVLMVAKGETGDPVILHRDGARLTLEQIFDWLYCKVFPAFPDACFVTFSMGYDFSQWLRDMPESRARYLLTREGIAKRKRKKTENPTPFPVYWRHPQSPKTHEWQCDALGSKRFKLRLTERPWREEAQSPYSGTRTARTPRHYPVGLVCDECGKSRGPRCKASDTPKYCDECSEKLFPPWLYVCDAFSFFQCSFLKAIDPTERLTAICTKEEFSLIKEGKERRGDEVFDADMIKYCALECEVLARLMREQNGALVESGIKLRRSQFFGPGQVAQVSMSNMIKAGSCDFTRKNIDDKVPAQFLNASQQSYIGGWFEIPYHGIFPGPAYENDINSAYPKIMAELPCLIHGTYLKAKGDPYSAAKLRQHVKRGFGTAPGQCLCLVEAAVTGLHPRIGAMLHRNPDNRVLRPHMTQGWYWLHELRAANRAGLIAEIDFMQWHAYIPGDCPPPLRSLAEMYQKRLVVGKNTPNGKALKLQYNSCYGKCAQSVGSPKFANFVYASLTTAGCRCMILDAIATHPQGADAVLMIATDGIYFTAPHPGLTPSDKLGDWEMKVRNNMNLFKPGTYWDDVARAKARAGAWGDIKLKSRGVNLTALSKQILALDAAFAAMQPGGDWPSLSIEIPFQVISPQVALARGKWNQCGAVSNTHTIAIKGDPTMKRLATGPGWSRPHLMGATHRCTPYKAGFRDETAEGLALASDSSLVMQDNLHPDGSASAQLNEVWQSDNISEFERTDLADALQCSIPDTGDI
jgi:hypothetical protein